MLLNFLHKKCKSINPGTVSSVALPIPICCPSPISSESNFHGGMIGIPAQIIRDVNAAAIGKDNEVRQPLIAVENIDINGRIVNKGKCDPGVDATIGNKTEAVRSSIVLDKSKANGAIINTSAARNRGAKATMSQCR